MRFHTALTDPLVRSLSEWGRERWGMEGWEGVGTGVGTKKKAYWKVNFNNKYKKATSSIERKNP